MSQALCLVKKIQTLRSSRLEEETGMNKYVESVNGTQLHQLPLPRRVQVEEITFKLGFFKH